MFDTYVFTFHNSHLSTMQLLLNSFAGAADWKGNKLKAKKAWLVAFQEFINTLYFDRRLLFQQVPPDGDCFFHCLARFLGVDCGAFGPFVPFVCRQLLMDHIKKHRAEYEPFIEDDEDFDEYVMKMRKRSSYAGNLELCREPWCRRRGPLAPVCASVSAAGYGGARHRSIPETRAMVCGACCLR